MFRVEIADKELKIATFGLRTFRIDGPQDFQLVFNIKRQKQPLNRLQPLQPF